MPGTAADVIRRFWEIQNAQRYTELVPLFADDVVFCDPLYGRLDGRAALTDFMGEMERVVPQTGAAFDLVDFDGDDTCAWSRWVMRTTGGALAGQSLYRVRNGRITFDADYFDTVSYRRLRGAEAGEPDMGRAAGASAGQPGTGGGSAETLVRRFWSLQEGGQYGALADLFADDALFEDVIYGRFEGRAAITDYLRRMETEMPGQSIRFELVDVCGGDSTAWSQWIAHMGDRGALPGWTLHRVQDGKFTLDADYFDTALAATLQAPA